MDFRTSETYLKLKPLKDDNGYDAVVLPTGSTVYRGDPTGFFTGFDSMMRPIVNEGPSKDVPIFFGDLELAGRYSVARDDYQKSIQTKTRLRSPISSYETTKDVTLFVMNESNFMKLASVQKNADDKTFVEKHYILPKLGAKGVDKIKEMAVDKDTTVIQPYVSIGPQLSKYPLYSNRKLAQLVCAAGFDGWVVFPMTLIQTIGDAVGLYDPEIMICAWTSHAKRISGGRRYSRKYCKKTPCRKMGFTQKASCRPYKNCYTRRR